VLAGRAAWRSRANVRHPAAVQVEARRPFALDGLPGTTPCRPRSVAGEGRAFGACCFAGKLRSPAGPDPVPSWPRRLTPTSFSTSIPTSFPTRPDCVPPHPPGAPFSLVMPPRGSGASARQGALRAIDPFRRSRFWRTCGPRRLWRRSQPDVVATQGGSAQRLTAADLLSGLRVNVCRWEAATTHASHCGACLTFVFAAASAHVDRYARG
jgi:hypothetical protein